MEFNAVIARAKLNSAIQSLNDRSEGLALRPSNIGQCPLRLYWSLGQVRERDPRLDWAALQGTVSEELIGELLELAGCEVIKPPAGQETWMEHVEPDPDTGFKPHLDRIIRWPEVGLDDWCVLELKNLRATAQISLFADGLQEDAQYWYQAVSYLMQAQKAIEQYAAIEGSTFTRGPWTMLKEQGIVPTHLLFFTVAKDPSTTRMLLSQRLRPAQYEANPAKMKPEQIARVAWRNQIREKLTALGGDIDFYAELYDSSDSYIVDTYEDLKRRVRLISNAESPSDLLLEAISDLEGTEDDIPMECRAFCSFQEQHRMLQFGFLPGQEPEPATAPTDIFAKFER